MPYVFDDFMLDPQRYELTKAGALIPLRPKVFQALAYLLAHCDRVVHKGELLAHLWPWQYVGDAGLNSCILAVRRALGDSGQRQRYIRTVRGRGYRFVASVREQDRVPHAESPGVALPPVEAAPVREPTCMPSTPEADPTCARTPLAIEEYKLVTVLCGDLTNSSVPTALIGPEALYRLMQTMAGLSQEVMRHYEGTLTSLTGEGFTAIFGAPVAQEDHARRAVLAALDLHERLHQHPALRARLSDGVPAVRMGLHSGLVVGGWLGNDPQRLYTAVGAPAHLALRLQQWAAPGAIVLSAATYDLVYTEVQGEPCGTLDMDDQATPVPMYAVQGLRGWYAGKAGRGPRAEIPLVGRQPELAALQRALERAGEGQGQVRHWSAKPGWGSPAWCPSLSVPITPVSGWCSKAPRRLMARQRPIPR